MPFKSEKQRRFLWLKRPDIAKRWAHEYPESNKGLPMYAKDDKEKKAVLQVLQNVLVKSSSKITTVELFENSGQKLSQNAKSAADGLKYVKLPSETGPTYAGQTDENEEKPGPNPGPESAHGDSETSCENKALDMKNPVAQKLATILAPHLREQMEQQMAQTEGRDPMYVPQNLGIKRYAVAPQAHQLPMGMQAQPSAPQPNATSTVDPKIQGQSPSMNPINSYGALSSNGDINGNAAFGTKNSPLGNIKLSSKACSCGCGDTVRTCKCSSSCSCHKPGGSCYKAESAAEEKTAAGIGRAATMLGKTVGGLFKKAPPAAASAAFKVPAKPTYADLAAYGKQIGYGAKTPTYTHQEFANYQLMKQRMHAAQNAAAGTAPAAAQAPRAVAAPKPAAVAPAARPAVPPAARPMPPTPAKPMAGAGDELSLDDDIINSMAAFGKTSASSPAWQRSAGKNPEGGLNEKGRKSYERETGGNLKAPVTESNPSGERAKRQNSFCSRMCGMKKVNTGSEAKKDPDSRINKSLRKWNCKCSSAYEFGKEAARGDMTKKVFAQLAKAKDFAQKSTGGESATWAGQAYRNLKQRDHLGSGPGSAWNKLFQMIMRNGDEHRKVPMIPSRGSPNAEPIAAIVKGVRNLNFFVPEPATGLNRYFDNRPGRMYKLMSKTSAAYAFGKRANMLKLIGGLIRGGAKAAPQAATQAAKATVKAPSALMRAPLSSVHPSMIGPLASARGEHVPLTLANKIFDHKITRPLVPPAQRARMPKPGDGIWLRRFGDETADPSLRARVEAATQRYQTARANRLAQGYSR